MPNETTLHKLSSAFAEINDAEQSFENFWEEYHVYILVGIVVVLVAFFLHCCVWPLCKCVRCLLCNCCCFRGCCSRGSTTKHTRLQNEC